MIIQKLGMCLKCYSYNNNERTIIESIVKRSNDLFSTDANIKDSATNDSIFYISSASLDTLISIEMEFNAMNRLINKLEKCYQLDYFSTLYMDKTGE